MKGLRTSLTARMLAGGTVLGLLVGVGFAQLLVSIDEVRDAAQLDRRAAEVFAAANELERLTIDLETGQRGFVITGNEDFLEPWAHARRELPQRLEAFEALIVDEGQQARARELNRMLERYVAEWSLPTVELARGDREAAAARVATGEGKERSDELRERFAEFAAAEERIAERRSRTAEEAVRRAFVAGFVGLASSLLLIALFVAYVARLVALPVRRLAAAARRLSDGDLSARVSARGSGEVADLATAFNEMADRVEQGRNHLREQRERAERTASINTAVLESTIDGIALVGPDGRIALANATFERMVSEMLGEPAQLVDRRRPMREVAALIAERTTDPARYRTGFAAVANDPAYVGLDEYELAETHRSFQRYTAPVRDEDDGSSAASSSCARPPPSARRSVSRSSCSRPSRTSCERR